ncbi:MAG: hypothetical protein Q8K93_05850 [Reyranella sp.]|nr:hypothetical protein [Reyranella sp.]
MTTTADIKRVTRLLREQEPRLIYFKRMLILPPVGHYLRGFFFNQTSTKDVFQPYYMVQPLYRPTEVLVLGYGDYLYLRDTRDRWSIKDPRIEKWLVDIVLSDGMRALLGQVDKARAAGLKNLQSYRSDSNIWRHTRRLLLLMDSGQARVDRVLKSWEQMMVRRLKIEPYWQSPWPS